MKNNIVIFDFETVGYGPEKFSATNTATCDPIQVAAVPVDGRTLKIHKEKAFVSSIKPTKGVDKVSQDSLEFHAKVRGCTIDELKADLDKAPSLNAVWPTFIEYVRGQSVGKGFTSLPIAAGHNIKDFDMPILERINKDVGDSKMVFHPRDYIDTMNMMFLWMESDARVEKYTLDYLRDFFGLDKKGGHDALKDCLDCSLIIKRFVKYQRYLVNRVDGDGKRLLELKNSFKTWKDED